MAIVGADKIAPALHLTEQRVQQLVKNEGMPRETRGQYDLIKYMHWYIRFLQTALEKKAIPQFNGVYAGEHEERIRLLRADADLREIELAKQRSQLISIADHEEVVTDLVLTTKARILAIPARVAPELAGETSRLIIQGIIDKVCKESLSYLAKHGEEIANRISLKLDP